MNDLTLLLATANLIPEEIAGKFRKHLLEVTQNQYPIVSVSQKPISLGHNICVGEIGVSKYNEYKQILIGAQEVKTQYVACIDDDALYSRDHFLHRPRAGWFYYEGNYWFAQRGKPYYWKIGNVKKRGGMWGCIAQTETLLNNLSKRFKVFPVDPWEANDPRIKRIVWGEPGWGDGQFYGVTSKRRLVFSKSPCVIFLHRQSMGTKQLVNAFSRRGRYGEPLPEDKAGYLDQFGKPDNLWQQFWGNYGA